MVRFYPTGRFLIVNESRRWTLELRLAQRRDPLSLSLSLRKYFLIKAEVWDMLTDGVFAP